MRKRLPQIITALSLLFGLILFVRVLRQVGMHELLGYLSQMGWEFAIVLIFPVTWLYVQSLAWQRILAYDGHSIRLLDIFMVKTIGEAINTITPLNFVGGDPFRAYLLQKSLSATASSASVVIDRTLFFFATVILILSGWVTAIFVLPLTSEMRWSFLLVTIILLVFLALIMRAQSSGPLQKLGRIAMKLPGLKTRWPAWNERLRAVDSELLAFYRRGPRHLIEIVILHVIGRALGIFEILLIALFLGHPLSFQTALLLITLTILINLVFSFIPQAMGVLEGGYAGYFRNFGSGPPALGTSIQIVRRLRTLVWTLIGLILIWIYKPSTKSIA